jgi:hypothetical protein
MDTKARTIATVAIIIAVLAAIAGSSAWLAPTTPTGVSDTGGTATPVVLANQAGTGRILELQDASTPVFMVNDGGALDLDGAGGLDVDTTGAISLDADTASNFNVAGAGIDLTLESEAGRLVLKGDEAAANGITIDANDAVTTGLDIDVGSVSGVTIDGGMVDIGGGTCGVADGDNDVCIAAVLEVDGEIEADGAIDADAVMTIDGGVTNIGGGSPGDAAGDNDLYVTADVEIDGTLFMDGVTNWTKMTTTDTGAYTLNPTTTLAVLNPGSTLTLTLGTTNVDSGDLLILINTSAQNAVVQTTNLYWSAAYTMGQYDTLVVIFDGSNWYELSRSANS